MSERWRDTHIRVAEQDGHPLVIDVGDDPDDVFSVLADEQRLQVLAVIREDSTPMGLSTLVDRITDRQGSDHSEPVSQEARRRLRISLHHHHLPKMAAAGFVNYDAENHIIVPTDGTQA